MTTFAERVITPALQVAAEDAAGNIVLSFNQPVSLVVDINNFGTVTGTTEVTAVNGIATFSNLIISKPGGLQFHLRAFAPSLVAISGPFEVLGATPRKLVWMNALTPCHYVGLNFGRVFAEVVDSIGDPVVTYTGLITLSLGNNPGGATLTGTLSGFPWNTPQIQPQGSILFRDLRLDQPGQGYTVIASGDGLESATSTPIDIVNIGENCP